MGFLSATTSQNAAYIKSISDNASKHLSARKKQSGLGSNSVRLRTFSDFPLRKSAQLWRKRMSYNMQRRLWLGCDISQNMQLMWHRQIAMWARLEGLPIATQAGLNHPIWLFKICIHGFSSYRRTERAGYKQDRHPQPAIRKFDTMVFWYTHSGGPTILDLKDVIAY